MSEEYCTLFQAMFKEYFTAFGIIFKDYFTLFEVMFEEYLTVFESIIEGYLPHLRYPLISIYCIPHSVVIIYDKFTILVC
jgi:hypothetical protein